MNIRDKFHHLFRALRKDKSIIRFSKYLRAEQKNGKQRSNFVRRHIILVESQQAESNQIVLSCFTTILRSIHRARLISYTLMVPKPHSYLIEKIRNRNSLYHYFGCKTHYIIPSDNTQYWRTFYQYQIKDIWDLDNLRIDQIRIGDLIYDTYLRRSKNPTINFQDSYFEEIFDECLGYFYSTKKLFQKYDVKAVCVSHCVYHFAIPLRIAIHFGIDCFQITGESAFRLDSENTHAYTGFKRFKKDISEIPKDIYDSGIVQAEIDLKERLEGKLSRHMPYSTKSAFAKNVGFEILNPGVQTTNKVNVLVAIHDFFDSPHSYGDNFYPDFLVWLESLGEVSLKTDYNWYIKTHRDPLGDPEPIIRNFISRFSKFRVVDRDTDHHSLIENGINVVLTVYGTIAMEYPYMGVPAINASLNNPHASFNFSCTPDSKESYEKILHNLDSFTWEINKNEVLDYYFMANIYQLRSLIYFDHDAFLAAIGSYRKSIGVETLDFYLDNPEMRIPRTDLREALSNFIQSGDYQLSRKHFANQDIQNCKVEIDDI